MSNIISVASYIFCFNFLVLALFLFINQKCSFLAGRILAWGVIIVFIVLTSLVLYSTSFYFIFPHLIMFNVLFCLLTPLFVYFYFMAIINPAFRLRKRHLKHLIFPCIVTLCHMPFYIKSAHDKIDWYNHYLNTHVFYFTIGLYVLFSFYYVLMYIEYRRIKLQINDGPVKNEEVLRWIKELLIILALALLISLTLLFIIPFKLESLQYFPVVFSMVFYILLYKSFRSPKIFVEYIPFSSIEVGNRTFKLKETSIIEIRKNLESLLYNQKDFFLNRDISRALLAKRINIPDHHLSLFLNSEYGISFKDFINRVRIDEVQRRLMDEAYGKYTLEALGMSVGYNSRSAFLNAFKKFSGKTPSEYNKIRN